MMGDPYATSAFLDSSCFSILYPLYHNPDFMNHQQPHYPAAIQHHNAPQRRAAASYRIGPTGQREILSNAIGIPRQFPIPFATVAQSAIRGSAGQANQANREAPSINSSFISRIYSAQIPNQSFPPKLLVQALDQELKIIKADDYFISHLFPTTLLPSGMNDETVIAELSKPLNGESIWNTRRECFRTKPSSLKESDLAVWLNSIGTTLGKAFGYEPLRLWSHRSCETPAIGASSSITRKPDLILLDKKYYDELQDPQHPTDWAFIRAFGEVTSSGSISKRMTDSINSKAYLMFLCQYNRRFVVALSFTAAEEESFRLTVTDREGQIQWTVGLTTARSRERSLLFLRILIILMFGSSSDIGLDPNIEIDHTGRCVAITVQEKRFQVVDLIYSLNSVVGRGTRVWSVMHDGVNYTLKDCWVQHERVHSEVEILRKIKESKQFTGRVPTLFCGGDVQINGVVDCTDRYRSGLPGWSWKTQRIHRQLVCTPIGEPLSKYRSKQEFIKAIISILITHRMLFNDHGILHRDISLNNILFYRPKEDETADGLLIDFDYSEELDIDDGEELDTLDDSEELDILDADGEHAMGEREARIDEATDLEEDKAGTTSRESETGSSIRTGTPPFMAIEALISPKEDFAHLPRHDLESILYVILFICTFTKGPDVPRPDFETPSTLKMKDWFSILPLKEIGDRKISDMCQPKVSIIPGFTDYWADFGPFALDLIQLSFPSNPAFPSKLTHTEMVSILEKACTTVKEPPANMKNLKRNEPSSPPVSIKRRKRKLEKV